MYTMICYRCNSEMKYIKDIQSEQFGYIQLLCPKCGEKLIVPHNNPDLIKTNSKGGNIKNG